MSFGVSGTVQSAARPPNPAVRRPLFRPEAVAFQLQAGQYGGISLAQPISSKIITWSLVAVFAAILTFSGLAQYTRKETVQGFITPTSGTGKIFAPSPGVVTDVFVKEGEDVEQGRPLLGIATPQVAANGLDVNATVLDAIGLQSDLLRQQIAAEEQRAASERDRLASAVRARSRDAAWSAARTP